MEDNADMNCIKTIVDCNHITKPEVAHFASCPEHDLHSAVQNCTEQVGAKLTLNRFLKY